MRPSSTPACKPDHLSFYQDTVRETKQTAFFASVDFDIIPKVLTITGGTRHFRFQNSSAGSVTGSFGCFEQGVPAGGCLIDNFNLNQQNLRDTESGFKSRGNITWHVTPDTMVYYTFSQGFRPGGFNQNGGAAHATGPDGVAQYLVPSSYQSDKLTNNEIGWKTEFLGHRLQWNGAIYKETWNNVQVAFFNPGLVGNIFYNTNGQNFDIKGIETSLIARVVPGLTLQGAGSWNHSRQTNSPDLINNNPDSAGFGKPITTNCPTPDHLHRRSPTRSDRSAPPAPTRRPCSSACARAMSWRWRATCPSCSSARPTAAIRSRRQARIRRIADNSGAITTGRLRFENPAYTTFDASVGVSKDAWWVNVYAENLSNSNKSVFVSTDQFIVAQTPLRPRVVGVQLGYKLLKSYG